MRLCRVIGPVWATVKHPAFHRHTLLMVQPIDELGADVGPPGVDRQVQADLAEHLATPGDDRAADRGAVLLAPDITTAVALVRQRGGELGHLVRLLCDPRTVAARARLGLGVRPAG